ncbi:MAG: PH domain-containing protein, partial [bacterium]
LSPKKYLKKMISSLGALYVLLGVGIIIDIVTILITSDANNSDAKIVLWVILIAAVALLLVSTFLYSWYIKTYIKRYYYAGEEHFITIKKGVFAPAEIHVQWQKIQDVYVDQDILDRIMGLYDVHIASATVASGIEAHIDGVDERAAEGLKKFFLDKISGTGAKTGGEMPLNSEQKEAGRPVEKVSKINLSEEISSKKYPLLGKWIGISAFTRVLSAFVYTAIFAFAVVGRSHDVEVDYSLVIMIWLIAGVVFSIGSLISLFLWKKNYTFEFTPENIYFKQGVISLSEKHMPYSSIQDVTVVQGVIERFFGLGKVKIENAAQAQIIPGARGNVAVFNGVLI